MAVSSFVSHSVKKSTERNNGTYEDVVPEYIALPCPPEPVVAHDCPALDIILRVRQQAEHVKLKHIPPELLKEERPRYAQERSNARIAHEMRYIRIPITHKHNQHPHLQQNKKRGDSRACHLIRKRKGTLHRSQVKQMDCDDQARAKRLDAAFSSPIGPIAPPPRQIKPRDVVLEQLSSFARAAGCNMPRRASDARLVRSRAWKEPAGVIGAVLQGTVQQTATDPKAYATVRARRGTVSARVGRHVKGGRDTLRTCLHQSQ